MTAYPINFAYDRDGQWNDGFASTADEAVAKVTADRGDEWNVLGAELATCEVGHVTPRLADFERAWKAEIEAGWMSIIQVWGGYKGEATFWRTAETERADD